MWLKNSVLQSQRNIWRMSKNKIAPRLFGLDRSGNVMFYYSFNKNSTFGWTAVSESGDVTGVCYPLHWRAAVAREASIKKIAEEAGKEGEAGTPSHAVLSGRQFRQHHVLGRLYKVSYWVLIASAVGLLWIQYLLFRQWLNPPAREGLKNIEDKVLFYPKLIEEKVNSFWNESVPLPESVKAAAEEQVEKASESALQTAERWGYNPHHDEEEQRFQQELDHIREEAAVEETNWKRYALAAMMVAVSVVCLV